MVNDIHEREHIALREAIAAFGSDIIRAAAETKQGSRASSSGLFQMTDAASRDLSEKLCKLEAMMHALAGVR